MQLHTWRFFKMLELAQTHLSQHQREASYYTSSHWNLGFFWHKLIKKGLLPQPLSQKEHTVLLLFFLPSPFFSHRITGCYYIYSQSGHRFICVGHSNAPLKVLTKDSNASEVGNVFYLFLCPCSPFVRLLILHHQSFVSKLDLSVYVDVFSMSMSLRFR